MTMTRGSSDSGQDEVAAAGVFARSLAPSVPAPARLQALRARVLAGPAPRPRSPLVRSAALGVALVLGGASFAAYRAYLPSSRPLPPKAAAPAAAFAPVIAAPPPPPTSTAGPLVRPLSIAAVPAQGLAPRRAEVGIDSEARLLRDALAQLHRGEASAALHTLAQYRRQFPHGLLRPEADSALVDAQLALGQPGAALATLERLPADTAARSPLRLVRAELRAQRDCASALDDFTAVLAAAPVPSLHERALRGRAICRWRLGQHLPAHDDFAAYLARYPDGRFAAEARAHLVR